MGKRGGSSSGLRTRIFLVLILLPSPSLRPSLGSALSGFSFLRITFFLTPLGRSLACREGPSCPVPRVSCTFFTSLSWGLRPRSSGSSVGEGAEGLFEPFFLLPCFRPCDVTLTPFCDEEGEEEEDEEEEDEDDDEVVIIWKRLSKGDISFFCSVCLAGSG